jgi:hypothetical protein
MITSELENELRRTFALADAQITVPGQARQRLAGREYHPRRRNRRLAAGITATAAAAALVLILGLAGAIGGAPAHRTSTIRTAAFTLVQNASGTAMLIINPRVLFEPATLQRDLEADHIPAVVTTGSFCSSNPAPSGFSQVASTALPSGGGALLRYSGGAS